MLENLEKLAKDYFFQAMLLGYASGAAAKPHPHITGWQQITHTEIGGHGFSLEDSWGPGGGRTFIYLGRVLVWHMRYEGTYRPEAIPFLKMALQKAYQEKQFFGGRGPNHFKHDNGTYRNSARGDFRYFYGKEHVYVEKTPTTPTWSRRLITVGKSGAYASPRAFLYEEMAQWAEKNGAGHHTYTGGMLI